MKFNQTFVLVCIPWMGLLFEVSDCRNRLGTYVNTFPHHWSWLSSVIDSHGRNAVFIQTYCTQQMSDSGCFVNDFDKSIVVWVRFGNSCVTRRKTNLNQIEHVKWSIDRQVGKTTNWRRVFEAQCSKRHKVADVNSAVFEREITPSSNYCLSICSLWCAGNYVCAFCGVNFHITSTVSVYNFL